ncbi:armadillo-like helical domain-containing protein 4 isoform X2 [Eleutherodactylus coqui]|uniref:armadillo-like helical domain-containing protein 4 isoform X2 n=2 Tax=Eleutherodactylus coqui TaxID=57060 RepID=UPI003462A922
MTDANGSSGAQPAQKTGWILLSGYISPPSTTMKRLLVFHICGLLCSILLLSPNATCLSLQRLDKRNAPQGNGGFHGTVNSYADNILPPTPSAFEKQINNMSSYVTPSDNTRAVPEGTRNNSSLLSNSTMVEMSPETSNLGLIIGTSPIGQSKTSSKNGILTTAGPTMDYIPSVSSQVETNKGNAMESFPPTEENNADLKQSNLENSSQINTIEMLTTNPRTSSVETKTDYSTVSSHLADQSLTTVNTEIPADLDPAVIVNKSNESEELIVSELGEDWDDTKFTTQPPKNVGRAELTTAGPDHLMEEEHIEAAMFTTSPGMTVMSDDKSIFNVTENSLVMEPGVRVSSDSVRPVVTDSVDLNPVPNVTMFTPHPKVEVNQSQDLSAANKGVKPLTIDIGENSNVTVTAANYTNVTSQDTTREPEDKERAKVMDSFTLHTENPQNKTNDGPSTTVETQPSDVPSSEGLNPSSKDEEFLATSISPVAPMATTEVESTSIISTVTSVSHVSVDIPPTRRITTTASYGLDRLESEEGDEEDEDEEDEDDDEADEDDEEEEDDNKDDSVDDSSEKDSDIPLFTLPGLSSQEPLEDDGNVALIEGAAYPVPDTMEWEQQNQGLVRSWMEKLKDKAGYMSGMLVPVGVGIAGALFILGVLYSIKIMNRRRRNGFKRHKRKQREFNSMQDRVMLLADSSEDEF